MAHSLSASYDSVIGVRIDDLCSQFRRAEPPPVEHTFFSVDREEADMSEIDLDLQTVEEELTDEAGDGDDSGRVVLGVLDGTTPDEEWIEVVEDGGTLVLSIEGDVNELAAGFATDVRELDGDLMQFRGFLVVTPPGVGIDTSRLD